MCVLRYLKLAILSVLSPLMFSGEWTSCFFPKSIMSYFGFIFGVEFEIVLCAPLCQPLYLLSVGRLIAFGDQPHHSHIICEFDYGVGVVGWKAVVVCILLYIMHTNEF